MVNDTTRLLGLDGLAVVAVEDDGAGGPVVHLVTADERARRCPACATVAVRVKQWTTTRPRDLPVAGRVCRLRWRKRRWYCDATNCVRRSFTESVAAVPVGCHVTVTALVCGDAIRQARRCGRSYGCVDDRSAGSGRTRVRSDAGRGCGGDRGASASVGGAAPPGCASPIYAGRPCEVPAGGSAVSGRLCRPGWDQWCATVAVARA